MRDLKADILAAVADDLVAIELALEENLTPYLDLVRQTARHILFAGGKRLRPLLMVLSARLCGYRGHYDKTFSTIFEYLHAATLLHDDLVDGAGLRRGAAAAHAIYGAPTAVLVGDFLLARSLSIAATTQKPAVIGVIAGITESMSQGEIHQLMEKGNLNLSEADYLEVIRRKTAVLIQGACQVGALVSDAPKAAQQALSIYGYHVGIAFQMADDLLDYTADPTALGKRVGADLREGKLTLPVIHAMGRAGQEDKARMAAIIGNPEFTEGEFFEFIDLLTHWGGIAYTRQQAAAHVAAAQEALAGFDANSTRQTLYDIADYALARKV
jgi:octaprenyl-diphosphate synthase